MHLDCPECRAPVFSEDVDLVKTIAKCKSCNNIFEFSDQLNNSNELPARYRKAIIIPPGIEVLHHVLRSFLEYVCGDHDDYFCDDR